MSTPILPFAPWQAGTNQNSIPANDNSLRNQILNGLVISDSTDAQPGSPSDGDIYIMTGSASGTHWSTFDEFDLAIFNSGTWYAYAPVEGIIVNIAGVANQWDGAAYVAVTSPAGSGDVVGPSGAVDNRIAVFDGATGKFLKDGGYTIAELRGLALTSPENVQTGTSYTLVLSDAFKMVAMNNTAANTLTVPPNSSVAFPVGTRVDLSQDGAGQTTIAAGAGVTIRTPETLKLRKRWAKATLIKRATNTWDIEGNLEAAS